MQRISAILYTLLILLPGIASAQIYCYFWGDFSETQKSQFEEMMKQSAVMLNMKDVTFSIMKCDLPIEINATTEFQKNPIVNRDMILFRINDRLKPEIYEEVIAHEIIHAYQFYTHQLIRINRVTFLWRGEQYNKINQMDYCQRPWEIEAIEQGEQLLSLLKKLDYKPIESIISHRSIINKTNPRFLVRDSHEF